MAASVLVLLAINLAIVIPAAPSHIGTFECAGVLIYTYFGLSDEVAFNITFIYHIIQLIPISIAGVILFTKMGLSIRAVREA